MKFSPNHLFSTLALLALGLIQGFAQEEPNIIFIFADDWGYGDLGIHGSTFCKTPHLDQMAAEGIDFTQFTVNSPVCSPSRVAVMTGQFPARQCVHQHFAGVKQNRNRGMPDFMDPKGPSIARFMKNAGYKTGHFGKWHLGRGMSERAYGYDAFATFNGSKENEIPKKGLSSVTHAEAFIRKHRDEKSEDKDQPFFINLWLHETHLAHYPQPRFMEQFKDLGEQEQVYASVVAEGDEGVGRILKLLKELELDDNTLVVFSSDNGPEVTRGEDEKIHHKGQEGLGGFYSVGESGGLIGKKRSLFSGGIRVPLIVRWPGVTPAGRTDVTSVITAVDLLPTFLAAAGAELPDGYQADGENVLDAFKGTSMVRSQPIFWEWKGGTSYPEAWPALGVRDGKWKLLFNQAEKRIELYDISADWAEKNNVAAEHPDIAKQLKRKLLKWKTSLPTKPAEHCLNAAGRKNK